MAGSDGDASSSNKRPKIVYDDDKPIYDTKIVVLMLNGDPVAQVPVLNFQIYAAGRILDLKTEITEGDTIRWKIYTYSVPSKASQAYVKQWASWLIYRDLPTAIDGEHGTADHILDALSVAEHIKDVDYQDALVDAWMSWLQDKQPGGSLNVDRLQGPSWVDWPDSLDDLNHALILHHDAEAVEEESTAWSPYDDHICKEVRKLALGYFSRLGREPKDPIQLSDDTFCKKYHSHHTDGQPCYKTKKLPEQSEV